MIPGRLRWVVAALVGVLAAVHGGYGAPAPVPSGPKAISGFSDFEFQRLNRPFRDLPVAMDPVESGPFHIVLSSPRHEVQLLRHRLRLRRLPDGTHDAELWVQFQGSGHLTADVSALGLGTRLEDQVDLPRQEKLLRARLRIARSREGYLVTTVSLPRSAEVQLKSRLGGDLVRWCEQIPFSLVSCEGLDRAFSSATVPLPAAGNTYLLANADLTPEDRKAFDAYLREK